MVTQILSHGILYICSMRQLLEVEHFNYRERLKLLIGQFASPWKGDSQ